MAGHGLLHLPHLEEHVAQIAVALGPLGIQLDGAAVQRYGVAALALIAQRARERMQRLDGVGIELERTAVALGRLGALGEGEPRIAEIEVNLGGLRPQRVSLRVALLGLSGALELE